MKKVLIPIHKFLTWFANVFCIDEKRVSTLIICLGWALYEASVQLRATGNIPSGLADVIKYLITGVVVANVAPGAIAYMGSMMGGYYDTSDSNKTQY